MPLTRPKSKWFQFSTKVFLFPCCLRRFSLSLLGATVAIGSTFSFAEVQAHPQDIQVFVDQASSTLSYNVTMTDLERGVDVAANNYRIRGRVQARNGIPNKAYVSVSTLALPLRKGTDNFVMNLKGTIGGFSPSTNPIKVNFTRIANNNWQAAIDLIGDVDESTLSVTTTNGSYSGTLTITAIVL